MADAATNLYAQHSFTWSNADLMRWCLYVPRDFNKFTVEFNMAY